MGQRQRLNSFEILISSSKNLSLLSIQAFTYSWIAALLREEDTRADYINSKCSSVLVCMQLFIIAHVLRK